MARLHHRQLDRHLTEQDEEAAFLREQEELDFYNQLHLEQAQELAPTEEVMNWFFEDEYDYDTPYNGE